MTATAIRNDIASQAGCNTSQTARATPDDE